MKELTIEDQVKIVNNAAQAVIDILEEFGFKDDTIRKMMIEAYQRGCLDTLKYLKEEA